jgi:Bacterial Ig-like domain (group 1)/IPT/TIG domain
MTTNRTEAGDTLVEVLVALLLLGLTATALLGAFATSISASSEHRGLATIDTVLNSFVENATDQIQLSSSPLFQPCQTTTASYYQTQLVKTRGLPSGYQPPSNYTATVAATAVENWNGTKFLSPCVTNSVAPQLITARVTGPGNQAASLPFVVSDPDNAHPAFTSVNNDTVAAGSAATFAVTATGGPFPTLTAALITAASASCNTYTTSTATTPLPLPGQGTKTTDYLTFVDNGGGSGTLGISASTPQSGGTPYAPYYLILTASNEVGQPATQCFTLTVGAPTVSSIIPNGGPKGGGTLVSITGTGFVNNATTSVSFGGNGATNVTYVSPTQLTAYSPAMTSGGPETVDVTVTTAGGTSTTSSADQFTYNSSTQLAINGLAPSYGQPPSSVTAGTPFAVEIWVEDANNNLVATSTAQVTLSIDANPGAGFLNCTGGTTESAVGGEVIFSCTIDAAASGYTLIASSGGLISTLPTDPITIKPNTGVQLAVSSFSATAGTSAITQFSTTLEDAYGNPTSSSAAITINLSSSSRAGTFAASSGGTPVTAVSLPAGTASVTAYYADTVAGSPTITASATNFTSGAQSETITGGEGAKLAITSTAISTTAGTSATSAFTVTLEDSFGNATARNSALTVNLASSSNGASFAASSGGAWVTSVVLRANTETVTAYYADTNAGSPVITVSGGGLTSGTQTETLTPGPVNAVQSTVSASPTTVNSSDVASSTVTVTLEDATGNPVSGQTVTLTASGGNSSISAASGTSSASGVVTFTVTDSSTQSATYTAKDTTQSVTAAQTATVAFAPGPVNATQSTVSASPTIVNSSGVGSSTVTVTLEDAAGNPVSGHAVTLAASGGSSTISAASGTSSASGVVTFTVTDSSTESVTYTAKDATQSVTITQTVAVAFAPGPVNASKSTVSASPVTVNSSSVASSTVTVTLEDAAGNPVSGQTVTLTASGGNSSISAASGASSASGVVTFTVTDSSTESVTYTASDSTKSVTITQTATVAFAPGPVSASQSTVSASPTSVNSSSVASSLVTVTLEDAAGNPVSGQTVALAASGGNSSISPTSGTSSASGVVTFTVMDGLTESVTYTASDTTEPVTITPTAVVSFTPGKVNASQSTVSANPTSVTANGIATSTVTVTLEDAAGNPVTGQTVTLAASGGSSTISAASGTSNINGVVSFSVQDSKAEAVTYTANDASSGITIAQIATVSFTPGPVSASLSTVSANPTKNTSTSTITVTLVDANGNPVSGQTVTLAASGGNSSISAASGTSSASGVVTFTVTDSSTQSVTYTAKDTSQGVTITPTATVSFKQ